MVLFSPEVAIARGSPHRRYSRRRHDASCRLIAASSALCSILLLYWSVAFVAISGHLKWWRLRGRRNDVLAW